MHTLKRSIPIPAALGFLLWSLYAGALTAQASASGGTTGLFSEVPDIKAVTANAAEDPRRYATILIDHPTTLRAQIVRLNVDALAAEPKRLNLFADRLLVATRVRLQQRSPADYSWFGRVHLPAVGSAILVVKGGNLTASIQMGAEFYSIDPVGGGYHVIRQVDPAKYPQDDPPLGVPDDTSTGPVPFPAAPSSTAAGSLEPAPAARSSMARGGVQRTLAGGMAEAAAACLPIIRVLVAYTQAAFQQQFDLPSRIQLAVDETQQVYINSGVNIQLELAAAVPVTYSETGNFKNDLKSFRGTSDGLMDQIHTLRSQTAADIGILVMNNNQYCGMASAIKANASTAFAAVHWSCLQPGRYTFAHEIGHLQGARHNPENDPTPWPFLFGHGYRNIGAGWRTVMSYDCPAGCPRIPFFANPQVLFGGRPTGTLPLRADAFALNATATTVANFFSECAASGSESANASTVRGPAPRIYRAGNETLVALGSVLLKIAGTGGSGQNMFAVSYQNGTYTGIAGYNYLIGSQSFPAAITDVVFTGGETLVGLADGRIVKVNGTGGTGQNMFAISVHANGFTGLSGYPYYVGSHRFASGIVDMVHTWGETLISFANGKILKVRGSGGTGFNMMAIQETSGGFNGVSGYNYYLGDIRFSGAVVDMTPIGSEMFFSMANGKMLKTRFSGGTGHNMLAVTETSSGFNGLSGYNYYVGDASMQARVTDLTAAGSETLISFANGKVLKIRATGGTGHNMFAVSETSSGFNGVSGYNYYIGDAMFAGPVTDVVAASGATLLGLANGKLLKVSGTGGTGHNMFAVTENSNGFQTVSGYNYLLGSSAFGSGVAGLAANPDGSVFVSLQNGKMFKAKTLGGTGYNLFAVAQTPNAFQSLCCYNYWVGSF